MLHSISPEIKLSIFLEDEDQKSAAALKSSLGKLNYNNVKKTQTPPEMSTFHSTWFPRAINKRLINANDDTCACDVKDCYGDKCIHNFI